MRAVITAGGTAGHINPALSIADEIVEREPSSEIVFIGRRDGMEQRLVREAGFRIIGIEIHGLMRRLTPSNVIFNIKSVLCAAAAYRKAKKILFDIAPDVVIGCGGYVSWPVVRAAAKLGIKTVIQEQNAFPGMTTKLLAKSADLIFAAGEDGAKRIGYAGKTVVSGNPVRKEFFTADGAGLRERLGAGDRVFVLSYGGSNGAGAINRAAAAFMAAHARSDRVFHVHVTGTFAKDSFSGFMRQYGLDGENPNIRVFEYIGNMPEYYAASDLVISRAGALTVAELAAAGKASVLIPSPNVTGNHQYYNALSLAGAGAAFVYEEKDAAAEVLTAKLMELTERPDYLKAMGENAGKLASPDAAGIIFRKIKELTV